MATTNAPQIAGSAVPASRPFADEPPDWRQSGSPSSPKVTWEPAPRLGVNEAWDYTKSVAKGLATGGAKAVVGIWHLASSPVETLAPLVTRPKETLVEAGQATQQETGDAIRAAREGDFKPAGLQHGELMGAAAVGTAVGKVAGVLAKKAESGVAAAQASREQARIGRLAHTPEAKAHRIESNHGKDSPLDPADAVLKRPLKPLTETEAQAEAVRLERQDKGHSLDRHGPQLTPADHDRRVTTGIAADRKFSPTKASTQFHTAKDWVMTREKALRYAEARYGIEAGVRPDTARGQAKTYTVILEYNRPVDSGAIGTGPKQLVANPRSRIATKMHENTQPIDGVTRTKTVVKWDEAQQRWVVAQHMPWAEGWDNARKTYGPAEKADAKGVALPNE